MGVVTLNFCWSFSKELLNLLCVATVSKSVRAALHRHRVRAPNNQRYSGGQVNYQSVSPRQQGKQHQACAQKAATVVAIATAVMSIAKLRAPLSELCTIVHVEKSSITLQLIFTDEIFDRICGTYVGAHASRQTID